MSSVLTLLFAPSFLILINYFEFKIVVLVYIFLSLLFLIYAYEKKKKLEDFIITSIYLLLLAVAYFNNSFESVKFIPVFTAMTFFVIFANSAIKKNELIFKFTKTFYKKKLTDAEAIFLKKGDSFWAVAILIYIIILMSLVYYGDNILWAFYSSIGWYIYFSLVLIIQIIYGKAYAIKLYSK